MGYDTRTPSRRRTGAKAAAASQELPRSTPNGELLAEGFFWDGTIGNLGGKVYQALEETGYDYRPLALRCYRTGQMGEFHEKLAAVLHKRGITDVLYPNGLVHAGAAR